jgi:hypothetical protein
MSTAVSRGSDAVIPPSSLFVFWPGDQPPMAEEVRLRLEQWGHAAPDAESAAAEETVWSFWLELADRPISYLIWCERVSGPHLALLDQVRWRDEEQEAEARSCRWVVGLEGPLSLRHPTLDYQLQLRLCDTISRDWAPVVYDASGFQFRTPQELHQLTSTRTPPRTSSLYTIHKVRSNGRNAVEGGEPERFWLHTHGLERAGVPDLEIFQVPAPLVNAACELMETVASLWIQYQTPEPETPFAVGHGLEIAWRPWQAIVEELPQNAIGGWRYRRDEFNHTGYRAALLASQPAGGLRGRVWLPPLAILERMTHPETTLFRSLYETRRMSQLARERWGSFGMLFVGRRPADWRFAVKLRYGDELDGGNGEHLWFEVNAIRPGRIQAKLVSSPMFVKELTVGELAWHDLERLSDWRVLTGFGVFDPETSEALFDEVAKLSPATA